MQENMYLVVVAVFSRVIFYYQGHVVVLLAFCIPCLLVLPLLCNVQHNMHTRGQQSPTLFKLGLTLTYIDTNVTVLEKRSNFAPNTNFELGISLNRAISELQNGLSSMKNGQS